MYKVEFTTENQMIQNCCLSKIDLYLEKTENTLKFTISDEKRNKLIRKLENLYSKVDSLESKIKEIRIEKIFNLKKILQNLATDKIPIIRSFSLTEDSFSKNYSVLKIKGLNAGANSSIEKIHAVDTDNRLNKFVMKTAQPCIIFTPTPIRKALGKKITDKDGLLDLTKNIGWTRCTGREKIIMYEIFKNFRINIKSLNDLEKSFSNDELENFRREIFQFSKNEKERMPDLYLKMYAAFGHQCLFDARRLGRFGLDDLLIEANVYNIFKEKIHPNILNFISFGRNETEGYYLILEYANQGNLSNFLLTTHLSFKQALSYAFQIASGLSFLEELKIIHRDLKTDNILIRDNLLKISDFGTACLLKDLNQISGNSKGFPPEGGLVNQDQSKFDCWALGLIFTELVTESTMIDKLTELLDPIKTSFRKSLMQNNDEKIKKERKKLINCIEFGIKKEKQLFCGIRLIIEQPSSFEEQVNYEKYICIILSLLEPLTQLRMSGELAKELIENLNSNLV